MRFAPKVIVNCTTGSTSGLESLIEKFLADGVKFVAVVGNDCSRVEDIIDEIVVGDCSDESRFIVTTSHPGESLLDVVEFARAAILDPAGEPQIVEI